jgi:hypothetical protein
MIKKPQLNRYHTYITLSLKSLKENNLLDILDSVEEYPEDPVYKTYNKNTCKCCGKVILKFFEEHQTKCFQNKIENLQIQLKLKEEEIKHSIHIKGLELLIERNNEKWNKLYNPINKK